TSGCHRRLSDSILSSARLTDPPAASPSDRAPPSLPRSAALPLLRRPVFAAIPALLWCRLIPAPRRPAANAVVHRKLPTMRVVLCPADPPSGGAIRAMVCPQAPCDTPAALARRISAALRRPCRAG